MVPGLLLLLIAAGYNTVLEVRAGSTVTRGNVVFDRVKEVSISHTSESASDDEPVIKASDIANTQNDRTLLISANQKAFQLSAENKRLKQLLAEKDIIVQKQANTLSAIQQELVKLGLQLPK